MRLSGCIALLVFLCGVASTLGADSSPPTTYEWGTYRPNVYFGVRARHGSSPLFGLLWGGPFDDFQHIETLRHDAEERDHVTKSVTSTAVAPHGRCHR
jgi:hypothetical protein